MSDAEAMDVQIGAGFQRVAASQKVFEEENREDNRGLVVLVEGIREMR